MADRTFSSSRAHLISASAISRCARHHSGAENATPFLEPFLHTFKPQFCQDWIGTSIRIARKKRPGFCRTVRFWDSGPALIASNLTVLATCASENNDGVDIDSSHDALVENLYYDGCDDGVALKSGRTDGKTNAGRAFGVPTRDVVIRNVVAKTRSACIAIGSECEGGIRNVSLHGLRCRESW